MKIKGIKTLQPVYKDYISLIEALLNDIKDYDLEHENDKAYEGIMATRTAEKIKRLLPDIYKKFELG